MVEPNQSGSVKKPPGMPDFAPADPTDGREIGDWRSRYTEPGAKWGIRLETIYLTVLLLSLPIVITFFWLDYPKNWFGLSDGKYKPILKYGLAYLSGMLGGTLFDVKYFYHSVAKQIWNLDRRVWRFFIPFISGTLAFVMIALISSPIFFIFDRHALESLPLVVGVSFTVGYFSDNALAKLREVALNLFGLTAHKE